MQVYKDELYHHGIKGMKWGVRRYQNPDGTLTAAGKKKYGDPDRKLTSYQKQCIEWTMALKAQTESKRIIPREWIKRPLWREKRSELHEERLFQGR